MSPEGPSLEWELFSSSTEFVRRLKVNGGHIYETHRGICFVPDVDLQRYQSHLRDAYNQGFRDGQEEAKNYYQSHQFKAEPDKILG